MTLLGQFVIGMHLYGEVLTGVDELDEQWEFVTKLLVDLLSDEFTLVFIDELHQVQSHIDIVNQAALHSHTLMAGHATDFPRLADIGLGRINTFEGGYLIASPDGCLQIRFKLVRFHLDCIFVFMNVE